jgi:alpha-1,2-mannosyltransferase
VDVSEQRVSPAVRTRTLPVAVGVLLLVLAAASAAYEVHRLLSATLPAYGAYPFLDLQVYRAGVHAYATGQPLYNGSYTVVRLPFTYPPFGVLALSLAALGTLRQAADVLTVTDVVLLLVCAWAAVRAALTRSGARWVTVLAIALGFEAVFMRLEPVTATVGFGQVNIVLCALVVVDALLVPPRYRGILSGIATAVKLTPAVFVLYFLLSGQRRAAGRQILTTVLASLLAVAAAPGSSWRFWTSIVVSNRVGPAWYTSNQSFRGVVSRIFGPGHAATLSWVVLSLLAVVVAAVSIRRAHLAGAEVTALGMCALLGLLVSPISWSHHWVWSLPALLGVLCDRAHWAVRVLGIAFGVVLWVGPEWHMPNMDNREFHWALWQQVVGNLNVWLAVLLLVAVAMTSRPERRA